MENNRNQASGRGYQPRFLAPESKPKKARRASLSILLCVLAVAVLVGGTVFGIKLLKNRTPQEELSATEAAPETTEAPETEPPETEPPETERMPLPLRYHPAKKTYEPDESLLYALSVNPEILGRISYGDVDPQYIVYTSNNSYYLSHDAFGNWDSEGAAFVDCRCSVHPRDTNLLVHGHNMNVANSGYGKAFATLFRFRNKDYLGQYPIFKLETAEDVQYYVPYALPQVETCPGMPGYYPIVQMNFYTDEAFYNYTGFFKNNSLFKLPVDVEPSDQLLTFSTCINDGSSATELRLLVCLRRLRDDETVEDMEALIQTAFGVRQLELLPEAQFLDQ